jgi:MFS family permease
LSPQSLQWVVNAYTLTFGSLLLLGGRASAFLGFWHVFVTGLIIFSAASLAGGLAASETSLMIARALQGVGGALISPAALSILMTRFTQSEARNPLWEFGGQRLRAGQRQVSCLANFSPVPLAGGLSY